MAVAYVHKRGRDFTGSTADALKIPGTRLIAQHAMVASPNVSPYFFQKVEFRRNLFRVRH